MTMQNTGNELDTQLLGLLSEIKGQLTDLTDRLSAIETQQTAMVDRLSRLEQGQTLVADVYRYQTLQQYLAIGNWFEADKETIRVIQDIASQPDLEELSPDDIRKFPCNELRVIDQLWFNSSNGRFGFSVQLRIYQELGGTLDTTIEKNQPLVEQWGDRLGWRENGRWRRCDELDYSLNAPVGGHPSRWWNSPYGSKMTNFFLGRLLTCQL
jgi:hypothetical protein